MLRDVILGRAQSQISHEACFSPGLFKATEALISQKKKKKAWQIYDTSARALRAIYESKSTGMRYSQQLLSRRVILFINPCLILPL